MVRGKQREKSLKDAINRLKQDYPDFNPIFDRDFFKIPRSLLQRLLDYIKSILSFLFILTGVVIIYYHKLCFSTCLL